MKSRNQTQGPYAGKLAGRHARDWFKFTNGRLWSVSAPRNRHAKKALAIYYKHHPINDDIPF